MWPHRPAAYVFYQVDVPALQKIMLEFARENERSELTGELIGDTLDDALADDGDAEAEDKVVSQVSVRAQKEQAGRQYCKFFACRAVPRKNEEFYSSHMRESPCRRVHPLSVPLAPPSHSTRRVWQSCARRPTVSLAQAVLVQDTLSTTLGLIRHFLRLLFLQRRAWLVWHSRLATDLLFPYETAAVVSSTRSLTTEPLSCPQRWIIY